MGFKSFEDIIVWQKSQDLALAIYTEFSENKDFNFKNQITKAAVSISNNIAEGFDRNSNPEFKRFLNFASASNSEVRSMLYLSERLNYLSIEAAQELITFTLEISRLLYGLKKSLNR